MNDIYIAEDGTIHTRGNSSATSTNSSSSATYHSYSNETSFYEVSTARKLWFWLYSITSAFLIGTGLASICSAIDLGSGGFLEFFEMILPYGVIGGSVLGSILYGCNGADSLSYNMGAFILSPLCAIAGVIGIGLIICIVPFILICIWYVFVIALVIGVIVGIISGGD